MKPVITVFINPACDPCNRLKGLLKEKRIQFSEKDIVSDEASAKEFREAGGKFTPTTIIKIGEEKYEVIGANFAKIERILEVASV